MKDIFVFESEPITFDALRSGRAMPGHNFGGRFFEQEYDFEGGGTTVAACGSYQPDEVRKSNTEAGHLPSDFFAGPSGYYLIADFAVASSAIKRSVQNDPNLKAWLNHQLQAAIKDPRLTLTIVGYTDCVNTENRNTGLRAARAREVKRLIERLAHRHPGWRFLKGRITDRPAPVGQYLRNNSNPTNRATNRGVSLEVKTVIPMEPLAVNCKADLLHRALNLLQAPRTKQLMGSRLERVRSILRRMNDKTTDDKYVTEAEVTTVARRGIKNLTWRRVSKYFDDVCAVAEQKDVPITDDHIIHELMRLDNGFMNGICRLLEFKQNRATTRMKASVNALIATVWGLMQNQKSVYFAYQNAETECPTRSKPVVVVKKKPTGNTDPTIIHDPGFKIPTPRNQTIPQSGGGGGRGAAGWLWESIKGVAKMTGIFIGGAIYVIPDPVKEKVIRAAWEIFLRGGPQKALIGMAGEKAAQIVAEWALNKAGLPPEAIFDLNKLIPQGYPGLDRMTPWHGISVKFYAALSQLSKDVAEAQAFSRYLADFVKLNGITTRRMRGARAVAYHNMVARTLHRTISKIPAAARPSSLAGNITLEIASAFIRKDTIFMIPDDHVIRFHQFAGNKLKELYLEFGLPGFATGMTAEQVAPLISETLAKRFVPLGAKSSELNLLLEVADMLPSARRDTVLRGRPRPNWPSSWGPPPTRTTTVGP